MTAASFGQYLRADYQAELDDDTGETDARAPRFDGRGDVVVTRQLAALHSGSVVECRQCALDWIRCKNNFRRARVEGVGNDLGENGFFDRPRIGIPEIFEEMLQIDACFTHSKILIAKSVLTAKIQRSRAVTQIRIISRKDAKDRNGFRT